MPEFKISSFCTLGNCVEVGVAPDGAVTVRARRAALPEEGPVGSLTFTREEWTAFVAGVKAGEFDLG